MTQPLRQDERVLDYIYGELSEGERAAFEAELGADAELRAEVESMSQVRREFRGLPRLQQPQESVQRMTALLMQQAAQVHGTKGSDPGAEVDGGGKVVPLRKHPLRRLLPWQSPASGIFAAAAAALFWVVLKSQTPAPAPKSPTALVPSQPLVAAKAAEPQPTEKNGADVPAPAPVPLKEAFVAELAKERPAAPSVASGYAELGKGKAKRLAKDDIDSLLDIGAEPAKPVAKPAGKKQVLLAAAPSESRAYEKAEQPAAAPAKPFVQPPPPPAELKAVQAQTETRSGLRDQVAQAQDRRKERIVEELANQELGSLPGVGGRAGGPAPPQSEAESARYAQSKAPSSGSYDEAHGSAGAPSGQAAAAPVEAPYYAQNAAPAAAPSHDQAAGPRRAISSADGDSAGSSLLSMVHEHLRQGRCGDAQAALQRLEQTFPTAAGLAEARSQWQRSCQVPAQAPVPALAQPQRAVQNYEQASAPPVNVNRGSLAPQAPPKYAPRAKKAAPAKVKADYAF